eukprot:m.242831 g.242831  ORF g.242831 m.242831 type:complete len:344 (-) comp26322_c0_seq1:96-1127(-)
MPPVPRKHSAIWAGPVSSTRAAKASVRGSLRVDWWTRGTSVKDPQLLVVMRANTFFSKQMLSTRAVRKRRRPCTNACSSCTPWVPRCVSTSSRELGREEENVNRSSLAAAAPGEDDRPPAAALVVVAGVKEAGEGEGEGDSERRERRDDVWIGLARGEGVRRVGGGLSVSKGWRRGEQRQASSVARKSRSLLNGAPSPTSRHCTHLRVRGEATADDHSESRLGLVKALEEVFGSGLRPREESGVEENALSEPSTAAVVPVLGVRGVFSSRDTPESLEEREEKDARVSPDVRRGSGDVALLRALVCVGRKIERLANTTGIFSGVLQTNTQTKIKERVGCDKICK